jgi:hypothetical protein
MSNIALPTVGRARSIAFYLVVGFFCLFLFGFLTFAIPLLPSVVVGWFDRDLFGIHQLHEMNNAAFSLVIFFGMAVQLRHPERKVAGVLMVIAGIGAGFVINTALGRQPFGELPFLLFPLAAIALHPGRSEVRRLGRISQPALLALVAVATVPLFVYAFRHINMQLGAPAADTHAQFRHYSAMAGLTVAIVASGLLSSFGISGWWICGWGAGFLAVFLGATSLVFPYQASSAGLLWGTLTIVWGFVFIVVTERQRRHAA